MMAQIIIGPQIGEVVKDGKVIRKDYQMFCRRCIDKKFPQGPTEKDGEYFKKVEMKDWVVTRKDGEEIHGKMCPKCLQSVRTYEPEEKLNG